MKKKLQSVRIRRKEAEERSKDKLQSEINQVLQACIERINLLQREDLDLYERRKLAIEFKDFVDKYVNAEYRDNFYQFINHILQKYRTEEQYNLNEEKITPVIEEEPTGAHVEWPVNCTHIKIAYYIWNNKKTRFGNPLEIAQLLRRYYYEETANMDADYEIEQNAYAATFGNPQEPFGGPAAESIRQNAYARAASARADNERFNSNTGF